MHGSDKNTKESLNRAQNDLIKNKIIAKVSVLFVIQIKYDVKANTKCLNKENHKNYEDETSMPKNSTIHSDSYVELYRYCLENEK